MEFGGGVAKLTLPELYKDDEGLYTLRMVTKGGDAMHSAYLYVEGNLSESNGFSRWPRCRHF